MHVHLHVIHLVSCCVHLKFKAKTEPLHQPVFTNTLLFFLTFINVWFYILFLDMFITRYVVFVWDKQVDVVFWNIIMVIRQSQVKILLLSQISKYIYLCICSVKVQRIYAFSFIFYHSFSKSWLVSFVVINMSLHFFMQHIVCMR